MYVEKCNELVCACANRCAKCKKFTEGKLCEECSNEGNYKVCWKCLSAVQKTYNALVPAKGRFTPTHKGVCEFDGCRHVDELNNRNFCHRHYKPSLEELCLDCYNTMPKYCYKCNKVDPMLIGGECMECVHGRNWIDLSQGGGRLKECKECKLKRAVNTNSICYDCNLKNNIKNDSKLRPCPNCAKSILKKYRTCPYCQSNLTTVCRNCFKDSTEEICSTCQHVCEGCNEKFVQRDKCQIHCDTCLSVIDNGKCLNCKSSDRLDVMGYCVSCSSRGLPRNNYRCRSCRESIVTNPARPCENCKKTFIDCVLCDKVHQKYKYDCGEHKR